MTRAVPRPPGLTSDAHGAGRRRAGEARTGGDAGDACSGGDAGVESDDPPHGLSFVFFQQVNCICTRGDTRLHAKVQAERA